MSRKGGLGRRLLFRQEGLQRGETKGRMGRKVGLDGGEGGERGSLEVRGGWVLFVGSAAGGGATAMKPGGEGLKRPRRGTAVGDGSAKAPSARL